MPLSIDKNRVANLASISPRRISLATTHASAIKRDATRKFVGSISFPFAETVQPIFEGMTLLHLFGSRFGGVWRSITTEPEYQKIEMWKAQIGSLVFLRDCLTSSVSLGEHMSSDGVRTEIGSLEYRAKYERNSLAVNELINRATQAIRMLPGFNAASAILAVPSRPDKDFDLPSLLAAGCSQALGIPDYTSNLSWAGTKESLKALPLSQKWDALDSVGLKAGSQPWPGRVILVDDLYQSGTTMQWVAGQLSRVGVQEVYGLSITKSRNNSDNA